MAILTGDEIEHEMRLRRIVIEPFDPACLGANSYDVHLGSDLAEYEAVSGPNRHDRYLDAKRENPIFRTRIVDSKMLVPGRLYLSSTTEYTETHAHVPFLEGKSSTGRLGISVHATAGKGDIGFCNHWTLELSCIVPVVVYAGMPIAQLLYHTVRGDIRTNYTERASSKYRERSALPMPSMMWKNFPRDGK